MPFPHRDLILLLTFWVILITLVGQGLLLPPVLRWLGLGKVAETEQKQESSAELAARRAAIDAVLRRLDQLASERNLPEPLVERLRTRHLARLDRAESVDPKTRTARSSRSMTRSKGCSSKPSASTFSASSNAAN
jgi:NhaP-type Na+/H+ or K+/H+ antiporter